MQPTFRWVPEAEKSKFISITYSGSAFGTVITYPLCGYILATLDWEVIYKLCIINSTLINLEISDKERRCEKKLEYVSPFCTP